MIFETGLSTLNISREKRAARSKAASLGKTSAS